LRPFSTSEQDVPLPAGLVAGFAGSCFSDSSRF
jgi:hypothetical protein